MARRLRREGVDHGREVPSCPAGLPLPPPQGADFLRLHTSHGCWAQLGGADQWGNITAGVELVRRVKGGAATGDGEGGGCDAGGDGSVYGLTTPLLTTADGRKFGKSEGGGGVWLDPSLTSDSALFQYLRRTGGEAGGGRHSCC